MSQFISVYLLNQASLWWQSWWRIHLQCRKPGLDPWVGKIPWRRKWYPTPVFLPGKSHGQRNLAGYSPWGCKESNMTEQLSMHTSTVSKRLSPSCSHLIFPIRWLHHGADMGICIYKREGRFRKILTHCTRLQNDEAKTWIQFFQLFSLSQAYECIGGDQRHPPQRAQSWVSCRTEKGQWGQGWGLRSAHRGPRTTE